MPQRRCVVRTRHPGYDIYPVIYGARASILVVFTTIFTTTLGAIIGVIAAFYGRWVDALSR